MKNPKNCQFLRMANKAKAIKLQIVELEKEWDAAKKCPVRFTLVIGPEDLGEAIYVMETLARDAFMLSPEAAK